MPSVFGRLWYLSSLWDENTDRYRERFMSRIFGEETSDRALRHVHKETFYKWLSLTLHQREADLDDYLRNFETKSLLECWIQMSLYRELLPCDAMPYRAGTLSEGPSVVSNK
jgi:hypothetical protein